MDLRITTYNTLSLVTRGQASVLASEMRRLNVKLLALQECRECADAIRFHDGICKVTSQPQDGRFGCEVWIDCAKPLGSTCDGDQIAWNRRSMALLYSEPRILVVGAQAGMHRFSIVSAQACTSVAPHEDKQKFWDDLGKAMNAIPRGYIPLLMRDANARFDPGIEVPHNRCYNAFRFLELLQRHSLRMSGNIDANGVDIVSWVHPGLPESKSCIDYVAVPKAWSLGFEVVGDPDLCDIHGGHDHFPVAVELQATLRGHSRDEKRIDVEQLHTAEARAKAEKIFTQAPAVPWCVDVDQHLALVNDYLANEFAREFPRHSKPRKPALSEDTWKIIARRRGVRRALRRSRALEFRHVLHVVFLTWRQCCDEGSTRGQLREHDGEPCGELASVLQARSMACVLAGKGWLFRRVSST